MGFEIISLFEGYFLMTVRGKYEMDQACSNWIKPAEKQSYSLFIHRIWISTTTATRWRIKKHFRQTFSSSNMFIQVIFVFEDSRAILTNIIGRLGVNKSHMTLHIPF